MVTEETAAKLKKELEDAKAELASRNKKLKLSVKAQPKKKEAKKKIEAKKKEEELAFSFCTIMFFIKITLPAGQRNNS